MKNDKSIDGVFDYMFIDTGKIVGGLGNKPPVMTNTVSVEIDLAREIYERLLSKGWRKIEENWYWKIVRSVLQKLLMKIIWNPIMRRLTKNWQPI